MERHSPAADAVRNFPKKSIAMRIGNRICEEILQKAGNDETLPQR